MPRPRLLPRETIIPAAMRQFWRRGYHATSMEDLILATGASRAAIYEEIGGKRALYLACFPAYQAHIVSPALRGLDSPGAGLEAIAFYFETQISLAESQGLPGPGCLVANAATETAPHDPDVAACVRAHNRRLHNAFETALGHACPALRQAERADLAAFVTLTAQGLWSMSRSAESAKPLRTHGHVLLNLLRARLSS